MMGRRGFLVGAAAVGAVMPVCGTQGAAVPPDWRPGWSRPRAPGRRHHLYDPSYVKLGYPGGDVPRERGVCTDVIVRAYRDGLGVDLQVLVHEDMERNFAAYPQLGHGPARPQHRPPPGAQPQDVLPPQRCRARPAVEAADFAAGDLVSQLLPGNLAHIVIVSDVMSEDGAAPLVIHNIGAGARRENTLFEFEITGRYRFAGRARARRIASADISRAIRGKSAGLMPISARSEGLIALSMASAAR